METEWRSILPSFEPKRTTMIVDPPATGLTEGVRKMVLDLTPKHFLYVSCNPATLARDLKELADKFTIDSITPLDMFPQTAEIEAVAREVQDQLD